MGLTRTLLVEIADESGVGEARRQCAGLARQAGFDETRQGRVALVATEIATNVLRHAERGGRVLARALQRHGRIAFEILGVDEGPGIPDVAAALRNGYSTAGTAGTGLGAVKRLSDEFDVYSLPDAGAVVLARILAGTALSAGRGPLDIGVVATPKPGQDVCGDGWSAVQHPDRTWLMVSDGLGHGPEAALASAAAARVLQEAGTRSPAEHLAAMHEALRRTRGAAVVVVEIRHDTAELAYAGIGNIAASIVTPVASRSLISHDGIVGHGMSRVHQLTEKFSPEALLVMHSDGLTQRCNVGDYPGLMTKDPAIIAAVLHRACARGRDDALVLVAKPVEPAWRGAGAQPS